MSAREPTPWDVAAEQLLRLAIWRTYWGARSLRAHGCPPPAEVLVMLSDHAVARLALDPRARPS